jgi:hypothetical protein
MSDDQKSLSACPSQRVEGLELAVLQELGSALRIKSEPEHIYTAAAVGSFGAVAWGVAALQPEKYLTRPLFHRPAMIAVVGILAITAAIVLKIVREHTRYVFLKAEMAKISDRLACHEGGSEIVPQFMRNPKAGPGFLYSIGVVVVSALAAAWFCWSLAHV